MKSFRWLKSQKSKDEGRFTMTLSFKRTFNILLGVILLAAILSGGTTLYYFLIVLLTVRIGAVLMVRHHQKNIYVLYYASDNTVHTGDAIEVEYKVSNTSIMPITHALIEFKLDNKMNASTKLKEMAYFASQQRINFSKEIICRYRGYYSIGQVTVDVFDPLLIEKRTVFFDKEIDITVYPRLVKLANLKFHPKDLYGTLKSNQKTLEDRTNIVNIRRYEKGDQLKNIHWKLSAKRDELLTKEFEQTVSSKLLIFVDGYKEHFENGYTLDREEYLVSFVASLVKMAMDESMQIKLILNDTEGTVIEASNAADFGGCMDALTKFESSSEMPFDHFIRNHLQSENRDESYVLITPKLTQDLLDRVDYTGSGVSVFTFSDSALKPRRITGQFIDQIMGVSSEQA